MAASYIGNDNVGVYAYPIGANIRIWYNMGPKAGATADLKVRQVIDKALNFDAIAAVGTAGFAKEVRSYFPDNSIYYHEIFSDEERAVDIEGAKALLEEAGYGDGLELTALGLSDQEPVLTVVQENR